MALTLKERRFGRHVAAQRQADNVRRRRPNAHGATAGLSLHEQGALAELAFLRMLGLPLDRWASYVETDNLKLIAADVGRWHVRSTAARNGRLIVHPDDPDDYPFALVVCAEPIFYCPGWLPGIVAKQDHYWPGPHPERPAFFVPQEDLRDVPAHVLDPRRVRGLSVLS